VISPDEALARICALRGPVEPETCTLIDATGRWASEAITARRTQPSADLSSMDGYAIRHSDLPGPWVLAGESAAGRPWQGTLSPGQTVRIFTGAAVPPGADTIIVQEDTRAEAGSIALATKDAIPPGQHVRAAGSDFRTGKVLIEAGQHVTPQRIGLAALAGHASLPVRRRVRIALMSTGDELVAPGIDPGPDRIPSSNAPMLTALFADLPVTIEDFGIVPDRAEALRNAFDRARGHDLIITTGGASVGDHDLVQSALLAAGASIDFWKIAMRPGKPLMAGMLGRAAALGLPGNPVSAFVTALLFAKPLIRHLGGAADLAPPHVTTRLAAPLPAVGIRTDFVRAYWTPDGTAMPLGGDSGMLVPLAAATILIVRPAGSSAASAGHAVDFISIA